MLRQRNRGIDRMDVTDGSETQHWQRTLWTMVGVQFVMSISFSILSPIMPLFLPELGVTTETGIDLCEHGNCSRVLRFNN